MVEIPAGVSEGMELRVGGNGHAGIAGGPDGDLYVALSVEPSPGFELLRPAAFFAQNPRPGMGTLSRIQIFASPRSDNPYRAAMVRVGSFQTKSYSCSRVSVTASVVIGVSRVEWKKPGSVSGLVSTIDGQLSNLHACGRVRTLLQAPQRRPFGEGASVGAKRRDCERALVAGASDPDRAARSPLAAAKTP